MHLYHPPKGYSVLLQRKVLLEGASRFSPHVVFLSYPQGWIHQFFFGFSWHGTLFVQMP